ncbi:xanthine/CO dehydrogenase XdhC/CoxF family maturation factor [Flavobacteriaceae bacterium MAR_2010_105]|nr:xanthine/CO dehydrogenase XdhC/CoxF family maturation factor [Flavobacteriaceae bacterium MAR_2010_105]
MTHEFKTIVKHYFIAKTEGLKTVLATVVDLDGSSYRKPGVRMLILENGTMIGAVSGGCVEKDVLRQAESVFKTGQPKMMTYDGRYRLGCEGILYILIEEFSPENRFFDAFEKALINRSVFNMKCFYSKTIGEHEGLGSTIQINKEVYNLSSQTKNRTSLSVFTESLQPCFKLMIFGAEHDAVQLCKLAHFNGWEVTVVSGPLESKTIEDFPGATAFFSVSPDTLELNSIDNETAIVLMSHNFANDLKYLLELKDTKPAYIGLLGPSKRREKLLSQFIEYCPDVEESFLDGLYGPAGLNIGAETPQEIAISILSEILSVIREQTPMPLKEKLGRIHT